MTSQPYFNTWGAPAPAAEGPFTPLSGSLPNSPVYNNNNGLGFNFANQVHPPQQLPKNGGGYQPHQQPKSTSSSDDEMDDDDNNNNPFNNAADSDDDEEKSTAKPRRVRKDKKGRDLALDEIIQKVGSVGLNKEGALEYDPNYKPESINHLLSTHAGVLRQAIEGTDPVYQYNAMRSFNEYITADYTGHARALLSTDFLPTFNRFLDPNTDENTLNETISVLINIAAGPPDHTAAVVNAGFIDPLFKVLKHPKSTTRTRGKTIWVFGNIAADNATFRDALVDRDIDSDLAALLPMTPSYNHEERQAAKTAMWVLRNVCGWRGVDWTKMKKTLAIVPGLFNRTYMDTVVDLCYAFDHIMANGIGKSDLVDSMVTTDLCKRIFKLMVSHEKEYVQKPLLEACTNMATGKSQILDRLMEAGFLDHLERIISSDREQANHIGALVAVSNAMRYKRFLHEMVKRRFLPPIVDMMQRSSAFSHRKEACWVLATAAAMKDPDVANELLSLSVPTLLIDFIHQLSPGFLPVVLKAVTALSDLLETGDIIASRQTAAALTSPFPSAPSMGPFAGPSLASANPVVTALIQTPVWLQRLWTVYTRMTGRNVDQMQDMDDADDGGEYAEEDSDDDDDGKLKGKPAKPAPLLLPPGVSSYMSPFTHPPPSNNGVHTAAALRAQIAETIRGITVRWFQSQAAEQAAVLRAQQAAKAGSGSGVGEEDALVEEVAKGLENMMGKAQ
ncbi:hypothetical protein HK104_001365 [Borealophlyctis nickersoniae]|nr:hypothetical protein HK104_001365 [Borealophlyctis nickersoniae]